MFLLNFISPSNLAPQVVYNTGTLLMFQCDGAAGCYKIHVIIRHKALRDYTKQLFCALTVTLPPPQRAAHELPAMAS